MNQAAIGILDSGVGGLATLGAARRSLPDERFVYLGDLARVPYGDKPSGAIRGYAQRMVAFLRTQKVKALAVACNTISAVGCDQRFGAGDTPIFHVLDAGADAAIRISTAQRIGVIATAATVRERGYERSIRGLHPQASVISVGCPLLVPLIEAGWQERPDTDWLVRDYLLPLQAAAIDTLVLGCTHYSFIRPAIRAVLGPRTAIADPALALADRLVEAVRCGLIQPAPRAARPRPLRLFVTAHVERFRRVAARVCPNAHDATIHQVEL